MNDTNFTLACRRRQPALPGWTSKKAAALLGGILLWATPCLPLLAAPPRECLVAEGAGELPTVLEWSRDVRWAGERSLFLSVRQSGVFEWRLDQAEPVLRAPRGYGRDEIFLPNHLAKAGDRLVVGSDVYSFGMIQDSSTGYEAVFPFEEIADLDAHEGTDHQAFVVVNGSQRDAKGEYAPEGALAWMGKLGEDPSRFKPLFLSESGPQMPNFSRCGLMGMGGVRFLADGSIFLVPGVEGGAYLYDAQGKIGRIFEANDLGIDSGCPLYAKQAEQFGLDEEGRWNFINGRRVLDEILPLPDGKIGLVTREFSKGSPHFTLVLVGRDGSLGRCNIPIEGGQQYSRLRGDIRGNEIVFLETQEGYQPRSGQETNTLTGETRKISPVLHPARKTRFFIFRYQP